MGKTLNCLLVVVLSTSLSACVAPPEKTKKKSGGLSAMVDAEHASTESIKNRREQQYQQMLANLQQRNAVQEARSAIAQGNYYVMGYYVGRGGLTIPGINVRQNRCRVQQLDGMGDVIYGDSHMKYRIAAKRFANQFNQVMLPYCR